MVTLILTIADRIANLQPPPPHLNKGKIELYRDEASVLLRRLSHRNNYLASRLESNIKEYEHYLQKENTQQMVSALNTKSILIVSRETINNDSLHTFIAFYP